MILQINTIPIINTIKSNRNFDAEIELDNYQQHLFLSSAKLGMDMLQAVASGYTTIISSPYLHMLLAFMPKSGSTYLRTILAHLPNMGAVDLVPGYGRREQELSMEKMLFFNDINYVAQLSFKYSDITQKFMDMFNIKPIFLVRNIFDIVESMKDFVVIGGHNESKIAEIPHDFAKLTEFEQRSFIIEMMIPWYIGLYLSWYHVKNKVLIAYEELISNKVATIIKILNFMGVSVAIEEINTAINNADRSNNTRKNIGVTNRGKNIPNILKNKIRDQIRFYEGIDFSPIGL